MEIDLTNKVALVTGSSMGIGRGCAEMLSEAGAHVIINCRKEEDGLKAAACIQKNGGRASFIGADMSDLDSISAMLTEVHKKHGKLDILVNNAGMNLFKGIRDTSVEEYDSILNLDLRGLFFACKGAVPLMEKAGGGTIVNIASVHASATIGNIAAYAAAKGGVVALTRSMCQELGPLGIRVSTISPGFIKTPLVDRWLESEPDPEETLQRVNNLHPSGRIGTSREVGAFVVFLSSEFGGFLTGANLVQDGGLTSRLMH